MHILEEQRLLPNGNHVKNGIQQMLSRAEHLRTRSTPCFFLLYKKKRRVLQMGGICEIRFADDL